ncbi:aminoacyl-tRNA hydrolase [Candidatus Cloacimonadota bacterium]
MRLILGLGNPGDQYKTNRHNLGFMLLDKFCEYHKLEFKKHKNYFWTKLDDILIVKPRTYMNRSGIAVTSVLTGNRIEDILVVLDDVNLPLGEIRLRSQGGFGGHNGLKSIGTALGTDNFKRLRIGINSPRQNDLSDYVLSDFDQKEMKILTETIDFSRSLLEIYIGNDFDQVLNYYSKNKKSYSEKIQDSQDQ